MTANVCISVANEQLFNDNITPEAIRSNAPSSVEPKVCTTSEVTEQRDGQERNPRELLKMQKQACTKACSQGCKLSLDEHVKRQEQVYGTSVPDPS